MAIIKVGSTSVTVDENSISWTSGMEVDADGAPTAYSPTHSGLPALDFLASAGHPDRWVDVEGAVVTDPALIAKMPLPGYVFQKKKWYGLACDKNGVPFIQSSSDLAAGYYVSTTALQDHTKNESDPLRYVNSQLVPYIAVPPELIKMGAQLGDLVDVSHGSQRCIAIVADISPRGKLHGEGSIALANTLHIPSSPKNGGISQGVNYKILLGTATDPAWPRALPLSLAPFA